MQMLMSKSRGTVRIHCS